MNTLFSLEQFRKTIGYHPWHFWGLADTETVPITSACNSLVHKYAWQSANAAGRNDIQDAIDSAVDMLTDQIGFSPAPQWFVDTVDFPEYLQPNLLNVSHGQLDGRWREIKAKNGYLKNLGVETRTLISEETITFSDPDGDGLDEVFTATVATTVTDPDELHVYFAASDRIDSDPVSEDYRISPLKITISGGTATIKGKSWQVVNPITYEAQDGAIDPTSASSFVNTVEIYRHYTDQTGITTTDCHALLIWETLPYPAWAVCCGDLSFTDSSSDPAALAYGIARAGVRHSREGIFYLGRAVYNSTTGVWEQTAWGSWYPPARVQVRYMAGYPLVSGEMARNFQKAVARLAAAELEERICACDQSNRELWRWQFDLSTTRGPAGESYQPTPSLNNPFGTRRGHVFAWDFVKRWRMVPAVTF